MYVHCFGGDGTLGSGEHPSEPHADGLGPQGLQHARPSSMPKPAFPPSEVRLALHKGCA